MPEACVICSRPVKTDRGSAYCLQCGVRHRLCVGCWQTANLSGSTRWNSKEMRTEWVKCPLGAS
jgi:hypothetical protein